MGNISEYRQRVIDELRRKAYALHKEGFTLREAARAIGKSHEFVRQAVIWAKKRENSEFSTREELTADDSVLSCIHSHTATEKPLRSLTDQAGGDRV